MPSGTWWSGISVSGWSNVDYVTWQLAGPSSTNNPNANLRFRTGIGTSWNGWKMVLDKDYADGLYVRKTGDTMTGSLFISADAINPPSLSAPPKLVFSAANGSQQVAFVYTDFDAYRAPAGIILMGNQGGEWFEAPWIISNKFSADVLSTQNMSGGKFVANYFGNGSMFDGTGSTMTGTIKIVLPITWSNTMAVYKIMLYEYDNKGSSEITVSFYNYTTSPGYYNYSYQVNGEFSGDVRVAYDDNARRCCILLGSLTYEWHYPKVFLYQIFGGQNTTNHYVINSFSISIITAETGLSRAVLVPKTSMNRYDDNYIRAINKNGYYGMGKVGNIDTDWIRTAKPGLIPFEPGSSSGNSFLGTETWQFGKIFGAIIYGQRVCSLNHNLYIGSSGNSGWVYCQDLCSADGTAEAYWSIRTNGAAVFTNLTSKNTIFSSIGLKSRNICIETDNSGNDGGCSSEINNWNSRLYLQHKSGQHLQMCNGGGNVAIGGISPDYKLNVSGDIRASSWIRTDGATGWYSQSYGGGIYMTDSDMVQVYNNKVLYNSGYRSWGIGGHYCGIKLYNTNHIGINLANSSYTWGIYSNQDGNMYIGRRNGDVNNTTGSYVVTITGSTLSVTGSVVASGEVTAYSDARLKSNIHTLNYRGRLIPRHYVKDSKQSIGFIAQEVQALYPELVLGQDKNRPYLSLNYNGCTAVLSAQLNHVEDEVTTLKNKVRELEIKVSVLTEQLHSQAI